MYADMEAVQEQLKVKLTPLEDWVKSHEEAFSHKQLQS
jgi:hypothetical protein